MRITDLTLADVFASRAQLTPMKTAILCGENQEPYAELYARGKKFADYLLSQGINPGDRVMVLSLNCHRVVEIFAACAIGGFVFVPINIRLSLNEITYIFEDAEPKVLIAQISFSEIVGKLLERSKIVLPISLDAQAEWTSQWYEDCLSTPRSLSTRLVQRDAPVALMYTAAVEGFPRGAILTQGSYVAQDIQTGWAFQLSDQDVFGGFLPLYHVFGLSLVMATLHVGGTVALLNAFEDTAAAHLIAESKVSFFAEFAPMGRRILNAQQKSQADFTSLRLVFALDSPEIAEAYIQQFGVEWLTGYGQTETNALATVGRVVHPYEQVSFMGIPTPFVHVVLLSPSNTVLSQQGSVGEIALRGDVGFSGYWKLPELTERTFADGWQRTGDLAHVSIENGQVSYWFDGRKEEKDLIKPGGENVYPQEVERVLLKHPAVAEVCVFGVADTEWREAVKAVIVLKVGCESTPEELIEFCRREIASYKKPKYVDIVDSIPHLPNGQIDRSKVKEMYS